MPSYIPPKRATEYIFYVALRAQANTKLFQANPTLAAGDVKVIKDGGAPANITTLPTAVSGGAVVKATLSAAEMTADNVTVLFQDASGVEWCDLMVNIQTAARQIDDLAFPTTSGRSMDVTATGAVGVDAGNVENGPLAANVTQIAGNGPAADSLKAVFDGTGAQMTLTKLRVTANDANGGVHITNSGGPGIKSESTGNNGHGIQGFGHGTGAGLRVNGGSSGVGLEAQGGSIAGAGMVAAGLGGGSGFLAFGSGGNEGIYALGNAAGAGLRASGGATGHGIRAQGGITSGDGINAAAQTAGDGIEAVGAGGGSDINADIQGSLSGSVGSVQAVTTAVAQSIADELLQRGVANVEATADTTSLAAVILAILESSLSGTTWTIRKTDGSTFVTKTVTTDPAAAPITGVT